MPPHQPAKHRLNWSTLGYGTIALGENVVYVPAKLGYAGIGIVAGAGSWVLAGGDLKLAKRVWKQALGGDYMITPSMVENDEPAQFSGEVPIELASQSGLPSKPVSPQASSESGEPKHHWWHFWGGKTAANATPTPQPSPTPTAAAGKRHWWHFWGHKATPNASPTPQASPAVPLTAETLATPEAMATPATAPIPATPAILVTPATPAALATPGTSSTPATPAPGAENSVGGTYRGSG